MDNIYLLVIIQHHFVMLHIFFSCVSTQKMHGEVESIKSWLQIVEIRESEA